MGVDNFSAIINPPQSGIMAIGKTELKPSFNPNSEAKFQWDNKMRITVSFDHRLIDGALGAKFISTFKSFMENPLKLCL